MPTCPSSIRKIFWVEYLCDSGLTDRIILRGVQHFLKRRRTEVPAETFAGAHPSGWRRHLPFTESWVTMGLRRGLLPPPLNVTWI